MECECPICFKCLQKLNNECTQCGTKFTAISFDQKNIIPPKPKLPHYTSYFTPGLSVCTKMEMYEQDNKFVTKNE